MIILCLLCILLLGLLFGIAKYHSTYWQRRGIVGPPLIPFIGVLDRLGDMNFPDVLRLNQWTKVFGKTYGIQKGWVNVLVTSDSKVIHEMVSSKFNFFHERERLPMRSNVDKEKSIHVFRARGYRWKRLRTTIQPIFSIPNIRKLVPIVNDSAWNMAQLLSPGEVNVHPFCKEYAMEVISKLVTGRKEPLQFHSDNSKILSETLNDNRSLLTNISWIIPPLGPLCYKIRMWKSYRNRKGISTLLERIKTAVDERKNSQIAGVECCDPDFIEFFLRAESTDKVESEVSDVFFNSATDVQKKLTKDEIVAQLKFFNIAGFDTVSNTLSLVIFYLAKFSGIQEQIREEIKYLDEIPVPSYEDLKELKFCEAVIRETLRLNPIATNAFARTCTRNTTLNGLAIEEGTIVLVDLFALHKDQEVWGTNSEEFLPERWLLNIDMPKHAYYPFGGGFRMCTGINLAFVELKLALVQILRRFHIFETPNTGDAPVLVSNTVLNTRDVIVRLETVV